LTRPLAGLRYDPSAQHGHVESYALEACDPAGERAIWIRASVYASARAPAQAIAETWAVAFDRSHGHLAVKAAVPFERARFDRSDLVAAIDGSSFTRKAWRGSVATGERRLSWDLAVSRAASPLEHLGQSWMYEAEVPGFKSLALAPDARVTGEVHAGERAWSIDGWPARIGHDWGARQTAGAVRGHCNSWLESERSEGADDALVFEGAARNVPVGPFEPPLAALFVRYRGERFDFNGVLDLCRNVSQATRRRWAFAAKSRLGSLEGEIWAATDELVGLLYPDPGGAYAGSGGGQMVTCLASKLAHAEIRFEPRGGPVLRLRSRSAGLEILTRDPNHGVVMVL
jgi:hypothetical protein